MKLAIKTLVAAALLGGLLSLVDVSAAMHSLAWADPWAVLTALLVSALGVIFSAFKWQQILAARSIRMSLALSTRIYWIGMLVSNVLPTSIGGDAVRIWLAADHGEMPELTASVVFERLTGLIVLLLIFATAMAVDPHHVRLPWGVGPMVILVAAVVAMAVILPKPLQRLCDRIPHRTALIGRLASFSRKVLGALGVHHADPRSLLTALILSIPFYATILLAHVAVLYAVGVQVSLLDVAVAAPLVALVGVLPLTPNGIGVAEGAFVAIYASLGVPPEAALAAALLRRIVDIANSSIGAVLLLAGTRVRLGHPFPWR